MPSTVALATSAVPASLPPSKEALSKIKFSTEDEPVYDVGAFAFEIADRSVA